MVENGPLQISCIFKFLRTLTGTTKSAILSFLPSLGSDCSLGIEDVVRIVFRLDLLQCRVVPAEEVFLEIGLAEIGLGN